MAFLCDLIEQRAIDRAADAERKNARVRVAFYLGDYFVVVADLAIGHKTDDAKVVLGIRRFERSLDGLHHLCAASSLPPGEKRLGRLEICLRRRDWFVEQHRGVAGKCY